MSVLDIFLTLQVGFLLGDAASNERPTRQGTVVLAAFIVTCIASWVTR